MKIRRNPGQQSVTIRDRLAAAEAVIQQKEQQLAAQVQNMAAYRAEFLQETTDLKRLLSEARRGTRKEMFDSKERSTLIRRLTAERDDARAVSRNAVVSLAKIVAWGQP